MGALPTLIMAGQTDSGWNGSGWLDVVEQLAMQNRRPVLIIPNKGGSEWIGQIAPAVIVHPVLRADFVQS
jgi:hypothetical protein